MNTYQIELRDKSRNPNEGMTDSVTMYTIDDILSDVISDVTGDYYCPDKNITLKRIDDWINLCPILMKIYS